MKIVIQKRKCRIYGEFGKPVKIIEVMYLLQLDMYLHILHQHSRVIRVTDQYTCTELN